MALTVQDLINRNLFPGLRLAAGIRGVENRITWVNIMEILDTPQTTKSGELLITTGYGLAEESKYSDIIPQLKGRGISGIAIQPGYYIDTIPGYILDAADDCGLPILSLPPDYSFSDLLHVLIGEIGSETELLSPTGFDSGYFLQTLTEHLSGSPQSIFTGSQPAFLLCVRAVNASAVKAEQMEQAMKQLKSQLQDRSQEIIPVVRSGGLACFLLSLKEKQHFNALSYDIQLQLTLFSEQVGVRFYAGSDRLMHQEALPLGFRHTAQCLSLLQKLEAKRGICPYENYDFIETFGSLYLAGRDRFVQSKQLRILLEQDRSKGSDYVRTLRLYLSENCNTSRTAERLFIHRHTLLNRLESIRNLSGLDLQNYYSRLSMSCALMLHDLYGVS